MRFVCAAKAKWVMDLLPKINTVRRLRPKPRAARAARGGGPACAPLETPHAWEQLIQNVVGAGKCLKCRRPDP